MEARSASALSNGEQMTLVSDMPLSGFGAIAQSLVAKGFAQRAWTPASDAAISLAPLGDPSWTKCHP